MDFPGGQWLRLHTSTVGGTDLIPGRGSKILRVSQNSRNVIKKKNKTVVLDYESWKKYTRRCTHILRLKDKFHESTPAFPRAVQSAGF